MVQGRGMLRHAQRVMRRKHVAELVDAQALCLHAHIHGHQAWILAQFKPFDLQMMFRDADTGIAGLVAQPGVRTNLIEHTPIEDGIFAGHALLQFSPPANSHVHEGVKLHGILLMGTHTRRKGMQLSSYWAVSVSSRVQGCQAWPLLAPHTLMPHNGLAIIPEDIEKGRTIWSKAHRHRYQCLGAWKA